MKPTGSDGSNAILHAIEGSTGYHWILPIKKKSDAPQAVELFTSRIYNMAGGFRTQVWVCDNAPKFVKGPMRLLANKLGITFRNGAPYVPKHQGRIERAGRVLMEAARASTIDSNIPEELWPYAVRHAAVVANLLPTRTNIDNRSPLGALCKALNVKEHITIRKLRTCGYIAYLKEPTRDVVAARKMQPRAWVGKLVGYEGIKGHIAKIWVPKLQCLVRARDVQLHEGSDGTNPQSKEAEFEAVFRDPIIEGSGRVVVERSATFSQAPSAGTQADANDTSHEAGQYDPAQHKAVQYDIAPQQPSQSETDLQRHLSEGLPQLLPSPSPTPDRTLHDSDDGDETFQDAQEVT